MGKRSKVLNTFTAGGSSGVQGGIFLSHIDSGVGIALVVFEAQVIPWLMRFNQFVFEHQRIDFAGSDYPLNAVSFSHEHRSFIAAIGVPQEIRIQSLAKNFRFPDIDHFSVNTAKEVATTRQRNPLRTFHV